ncbi:MAG: chemotaxis protein CheW [Marinilabiliaceae bacterium]
MSKKEDKKVNAYLSFRLGEEFFAIHVDRVHKIMEFSQITGIPKSPDYMKGVINLRGTVLPVIDTRVKFGMQPVEPSKSTSILVIDVKIGNEMVKTGLLVDGVQAVEQLEEEDLLPPPGIGDRYKAGFISYMAKVKDKFYIVLDIDAVFSVDEQIDIRDISKAGEQIVENNAPGK